MAVVAFCRYRFDASDIALFRICFDYYAARRGWAHWRRQTFDDSDLVVIDDAVETVHLALLRASDGRYHAFDDDFEAVAEAWTMRELLMRLGLVLAWSCKPAAHMEMASRAAVPATQACPALIEAYRSIKAEMKEAEGR